MTFPSVLSLTFGGTGGVDANQYTPDIPDGNAGEVVIVIVSQDLNPTFTIDTGYSGTKWNIIGKDSYLNTNSSIIYWKVSETGVDDLRIDVSISDQATWAIYRCDHASRVSATSFSFNGSNVDPPLHTPPDGIQDYLWIAVRANDGQLAANASPSGYGTLNKLNSTPSGATISVAERAHRASSEDPGPFTSGTEQNVAWTIAVSPVQDRSAIVQAASTVTTSPQLTSRATGVVSGNGDLTATGKNENVRNVSVVSVLTFSAERIASGQQPIQDHDDLDLFDHDGNTIDGTGGGGAVRISSVVAKSTVTATRKIIRSRNSGMSSHLVLTATTRRRVTRAAQILSSASFASIGNSGHVRSSSVAIRTTMDVGTLVGGESPRSADIRAYASMDVAERLVIRPRTANINTTLTASTHHVLSAARRLLLSSSCSVALSTIATRRPSAHVHVSCVVEITPRSTRRRQGQILIRGSVSANARRMIKRSGQISSLSSFTAVARRSKATTSRVSAAALVTINAVVTQKSRGLVARFNEPTKTGKIRIVQNG